MIHADGVDAPATDHIVQRLAGSQQFLAFAEWEFVGEAGAPAQRSIHVGEAVFGGHIVGILRTGIASIEEVAGAAGTGVVIASPGESGEYSEARAHALLQFHHGRVIARVAAVVVRQVDRAEGGVGQKQLHRAQAGAADDAGPAVTEEGICNRGRGHGQCLRDQRRIQRVDVDGRGGLGQVGGVRAHVGQFQRDAKGEFPLHVQRVLLHARRAPVLIDDAEALTDAGQIAEAAAGGPGHAGREGIGEAIRGSGVAVVGSDIRRGGREAGRVVRRADGELGSPEEAVATAKRGLRRYLPGHAGAWSELVHVGIHDVDAVAVDAGEFDHTLGQNTSYAGGQRIDGPGVKAYDHGVIFLLQAVFPLPAHADIDG